MREEEWSRKYEEVCSGVRLPFAGMGPSNGTSRVRCPAEGSGQRRESFFDIGDALFCHCGFKPHRRATVQAPSFRMK